MSWSAFVLPLHACPPDVLDWVRGSDSTEVPEELPQPRPLLTVGQVLTALREAGCDGDAWYRIADHGDPILPTRLDSEGLYLGEVSITVEGAADRSDPIHLDDRVTGLSFRKPGGGLLRAVTVLAALGGDQLVFDTNGEALVVGPDTSDESLAAGWPW
jgi:hypothetical protein